MPRPPDSTTDTYLDVLRTLGVTDAALHRHHGASPETPLRAAIDGDRGSPTADLLSALDATGRVIDLRDGLGPEDGDRLTGSLGRFGLRIEIESAGDAHDSDAAGAEADAHHDADSGSEADTGHDAEPDLTLLVTDVVIGETESFQTRADATAVETTLRENLLDDGPVDLLELLDGRHLVAEPREIAALAASYGPRIEPYDDPLLAPDAAIDVDDDGPLLPAETPTAASQPPSASIGAATPSAGAADDAEGLVDGESDGDSVREVVTQASEDNAESIESALTDSGPETHTIEDDEALAASASATVGGGPRRTVSTTGIDEVFDQIESSASAPAASETPASEPSDSADDSADATAASGDRPPASTELTAGSMFDSTDSSTDATASSDDADVTPNGLTGGPTRTVSSTSADDILSQATGDSDFETIAAEEDGADPDAVLAEAGDVPPALTEAGQSPQLDSAPAAATADPAEATDGEPVETEADAPTAAATAAESESTAESAERDPTGDRSEDRSPAEANAEAVDVQSPEPAPPADDESAGGESTPSPETAATPMPAVGLETTESAESDRAETESGPSDGSDPTHATDASHETVAGHEADANHATDSTATVDLATDDPAAADGPLAAAGGVGPDTDSAESDSGGASTEDESDAGGSTDADAEPGLVGRITSTIFGS